MLTNASKYGIRAIIYLAKNSNESTKIQASIIAKEIDVPAPFLSKLLQELTKSYIISSAKGKGGGFFLTKDNLSNTILDVIHAIDGPERFKRCFLGIHGCDKENPCEVHNLVVSFRNTMSKEFQQKTILEFTELS